MKKMDMATAKCTLCSHLFPSKTTMVCPKCYSDQSSLDLGNEMSFNGNLQMSIPKKPNLALNLSFSKIKQSLQYFSIFTKSDQEEETDEEYFDDLTEDYSTYYTEFEPLSTGYMKPSIPSLKKSRSHIEMQPTSSLANFLQLSCSKKDANIQTDTPNSSFYISSRKKGDAKDKLKQSTKNKEPSSSSSFLYRLDESQRKTGYVHNPTLRRLFRSNSDKSLESSTIFTSKFEDPFVSAERKLANFWRDLLNPEYTSSFLKLIFNTLIGIILILLLCFLVITIRDDFTKKREQEKEMLFVEIQQCIRDYKDNRCDPEQRLPAMEPYCVEKEKCMNQDPTLVFRASKMTAGLMAEILNEFVEPLGLKTIIFFFFLMFGMIIICNFSLKSDTKGFSSKNNSRRFRMEKMDSLKLKPLKNDLDDSTSYFQRKGYY